MPCAQNGTQTTFANGIQTYSTSPKAGASDVKVRHFHKTFTTPRRQRNSGAGNKTKYLQPDETVLGGSQKCSSQVKTVASCCGPQRMGTGAKTFEHHTVTSRAYPFFGRVARFYGFYCVRSLYATVSRKVGEFKFKILIPRI